MAVFLLLALFYVYLWCLFYDQARRLREEGRTQVGAEFWMTLVWIPLAPTLLFVVPVLLGATLFPDLAILWGILLVFGLWLYWRSLIQAAHLWWEGDPYPDRPICVAPGPNFKPFHPEEGCAAS